jgi:hypothetical protein
MNFYRSRNNPGPKSHLLERSNRTSIAAVLAFLAVVACQADQSLFEFDNPENLKRVSTTGANVTETSQPQPMLKVTAGHVEPWPGITLRAPSSLWDLSAFSRVSIRLRNTSQASLTIYCRVDNAGADGTRNCVTGSLSLAAGAEGTLNAPLKRVSDERLGNKLFGMRGYPVRFGGPGSVDPTKITQLLVFLTKPQVNHTFEIYDIRAEGAYTAPTAQATNAEPFFPFIDSFGQYRHKSWPGKVTNQTDLVSRLATEERELNAHNAPKNWDQFGGDLNGPKLKTTGFFRTEKVDEKWWLVDPEGHLFFSHGIDCVRMLDSTPIAERENWFENFPGNKPEFAQFRSPAYALHGHYAGKKPDSFSFAGANLMRKYGPEWQRVYPGVIHQRLRSWGLNTIANWSDSQVFLMRKTPYTDNLGSDRTKMIEGSEGYWGKFPDVFDGSFKESLRRGMQGKKGRSANDPWCIGYFSDNEMSWGDELSLGLAALKSPREQLAKREFSSQLRAKYGAISKLNDAWGTAHESWDALLDGRKAPESEGSKPDLRAFYTKAAEQYFRTVRGVIREVAPNQLYLGCRFAWVNPLAAAAAAKFCDVVSYNLYQKSVADFRFNGGADVPLIIGEFHFGALDRGMFHTGLVPVENQAARAETYKNYVQGALRHRQFVGCHWFQYQDEPTTGRVYDEENYQIGFVDIADTPYLETIQACREVGYHLYPD